MKRFLANSHASLRPSALLLAAWAPAAPTDATGGRVRARGAERRPSSGRARGHERCGGALGDGPASSCSGPRRRSSPATSRRRSWASTPSRPRRRVPRRRPRRRAAAGRSAARRPRVRRWLGAEGARRPRGGQPTSSTSRRSSSAPAPLDVSAGPTPASRARGLGGQEGRRLGLRQRVRGHRRRAPGGPRAGRPTTSRSPRTSTWIAARSTGEIDAAEAMIYNE